MAGSAARMSRPIDDLDRPHGYHMVVLWASRAAALPLESKPATPHGMACALPVAYGAPTGTVAPSHAPRLASAVARARTKDHLGLK